MNRTPCEQILLGRRTDQSAPALQLICQTRGTAPIRPMKFSSLVVTRLMSMDFGEATAIQILRMIFPASLVFVQSVLAGGNTLNNADSASMKYMFALALA